METPKYCRECSNTEVCLNYIRNGIVVYCGSSMCNPVPKEVTPYTAVGSTKWMYVHFARKGKVYTGFASSKYLEKI